MSETVETVESQGLTFKVNEITKRKYDEWGEVEYIGRNYPARVVEVNYVSEQNMSIDEFDEFLKDNDVHLYGFLYYQKFRIRKNGKTYYRHIVYEKNFD